MRTVEVIRRKRDGEALGRDEIDFLVAGITDGRVPDYQATAFLMAAFLRGLNRDETSWLTDAMVRSGLRLDLSRLPGPRVDKHSTGGVGDKTSLVVAPLAAACDVVVPMMSGRALGHTGGTVDKLESLPGFRTDLSLDECSEVLARTGCCLMSQTETVAPADRVLYGLRDVTATVESIPLISASIMSKKVAEGIDALVVDVKVGHGAFMKTETDAHQLASTLVAIGRDAGVSTEALLTRMDAPCGRMVGNAMEVAEAIGTLRGRGPADLETLSIELAARMIRRGGEIRDLPACKARVRTALDSGAGFDKLRAIVEAQGGDPRDIDDPSRLPSAPYRHVVRASRPGMLSGLLAGSIGEASMRLGAGRDWAGASIDPSVGIRLLAVPGDRLQEGDGVLELHYRHADHLARAVPIAESAIVVSDDPVTLPPLVLDAVS